MAPHNRLYFFKQCVKSEIINVVTKNVSHIHTAVMDSMIVDVLEMVVMNITVEE